MSVLRSEVTFHRAPDPALFFERCLDFLTANEAEFNLLLGMAAGLISGEHDYDSPIYLAWVERSGEVCGFAFRTPPFKLGVSPLPPEIIPALIDDLADVFPVIPAVMGEAQTAEKVAEAWARRHHLTIREGQRMRIHQIESLNPALPIARGRMRRAQEDDAALCTDWLNLFLIEAGVEGSDPGQAVRKMIDAHALFVWEDGDVVSMAAATGATPNGVRVGYVYTPQALRGKGYATSCVATLTEHLLATGRKVVFLYTDLANPTSNGIYARIGYVPVSDVVDLHLT